MIEIRYRAWYWRMKRMLEVGSIHFSMNQVTGVWMDARSEETGPLSMESCQLMQFTGLCDMKGRDIYEGDIVDDTTGRIGIQQATLVVTWN